MQEVIRDAQARDFTGFGGHGYKTIRSPRDPFYLTNLVEPTDTLRMSGLDWVRGGRRKEWW